MLFKKMIKIVIIPILLLCNITVLQAQDFKYDKKNDSYTLSLNNGLTVIYKPDLRSNAVIMQTWYKVGSIDEIPGKTGLAHVLEHMMFKQTKNIKSGDFTQLLSTHGANDNAFTSSDFTVYHEEFEKSKLELILALEAERMNNLTLKKEDLQSELNVVKEERRMRTEDSIYSTINEQLNFLAFKNHPYHNMPIGHMVDIENLSHQDVTDFYKKYYTTNNAFIVLVGNLNKKELNQYITKYFQSLKPTSTTIDNIYPKEPKALGHSQTTILSDKTKQSILQFGWKTPTVSHNISQAATLELLQTILVGHEFSVLNKEYTKEKQLLQNINVNYDNIKRGEPTLFEIIATPNKNSNLQELQIIEQGIIQSIHDIISKLNDDDLKIAKQLIQNRKTFEKDSMYEYATKIGYAWGIKNNTYFWDDFNREINQVTIEHIKNASEKYFTQENLTSVYALPSNK